MMSSAPLQHLAIELGDRALCRLVPCAPWRFDAPVQGYGWNAPDSRAVVLVQHGFGSHTGAMVSAKGGLARRLLEAGVSVYGFDLEGHGLSPGRRAAPDIVSAVAQHIAARRSLARLGLPVFVLGHSLGGFITASSVARESLDDAGAIVMSAPMPAARRWPTRLLTALLSLVAPTGIAPLPVAPVETLTRDSAAVEALRRDPLAYHGGTTNRVVATALAVTRSNWGLFRSWSTPVLVMHGSADRSVSPADSRAFFETLKVPDRTLQIYPEGRHDLLNDLDRDAVAETIVNWIEQRLPSSRSLPEDIRLAP